MQKYDLMESKDLNFKILNFREVLQQSDFHHEKVEYDFSLKNVFESVFPNKTLFEHSRIILNAMSENVIERNLITNDLEQENRALRELYSHFAH